LYADGIECSSNNSPDWKGPGWYRVVEPAGTRLVEGDPGHQHCNTDDPGYIVNEDIGKHPSKPGESVQVKTCFRFSEANHCYHEDKITITNCGTFFVYKLGKPLNCDDRYCTE